MFRDTTGEDVSANTAAMARIREAAETAKIELSTSSSTHISLPFLAAKAGEPIHMDFDLSRTDLNRLIRPVVERCRPSIEQALHDAKMTANQIDKIVLVDVTPLTLGVETLGGVATSLIARNTPIPIKHSEVFTTAADMQTAVTIHVYQGERPMAADNTSLGEFNLEGLAPAPRGMPKVEVTFDIDSNGILNVSAIDQATGKSQSISITGSSRLSDEDKKRSIEEAEKYAEADKSRREKADKLNSADSICYQAEKMLTDFDQKIEQSIKDKINAALKETKDAIISKDAELATTKAESLSTTLQEAGASIYKQTQPEPQPTIETGGEPRPTGAGPKGKVVDAEFRENN